MENYSFALTKVMNQVFIVSKLRRESFWVAILADQTQYLMGKLEIIIRLQLQQKEECGFSSIHKEDSIKKKEFSDLAL